MKFSPKKIQGPLKAMLSKRFFQVSGALSVFLLLASGFFIWWQLFPEITVQAGIPLHYNIHFGVDVVGAWWNIFLPSLVGVVILVLNFMVAGWLWKKEPVLSYLFVGSALLCEILLCIALAFIILLNLSYYG